MSKGPEHLPFVVRGLPSSGLDGAFRVHLPPEALEKLGLKVGELCHIAFDGSGADDTRVVGYGIAWRAADKMGSAPKMRPAKMTDTLKGAFGFKDGSQVTLSKTAAQVVRAQAVTLTDVTPPEYARPGLEDNRWRCRCAALLADAEAFALDTTFDVSAKKGLRKRFYVEHVEPAGSAGTGLFVLDDATDLTIADASTPVGRPLLPSGTASAVPDTRPIGGLVEQARELNQRLDRLLNPSNADLYFHDGRKASLNKHIIIHGYEGTGKSLLLDHVAHTTSCTVVRIDKSQTPAGKVQSAIQAAFKAAIASQPSLVVIDGLEELASPENKLYVSTLGKELDGVQGTRVLVIAATRSVSGIDGSLVAPRRFVIDIELPIPDVDARKQIINVLRQKPAHAHDDLVKTLSLKTHGFTGKDLALLDEKAADIALDRHAEEQREWVNVGTRLAMLGRARNRVTNGSFYSQASTIAEQPETQSLAAAVSDTDADSDQPRPSITLEDYEAALKTIRPTALRQVFLETPNVRWSDIGGSEDIKQRFDEIIGWPIHHPELLQALRLEPQRGVLLYGPPGCSKTMTAQAVAATYDLNFIAVKGAELISMYVGESERAVREVFRKAKQAAPCIVFFDEIDAVGTERDSAGTKGLNVLTTLLNEMDGFEAMKGVLVLAATNKPEILDPALLRPGRFDSHVYVGLPNEAARREILRIALDRLPAHDVDLDRLVADTAGYSGAELVGICRSAKASMARRIMAAGRADGRIELHNTDFEHAVQHQSKGVTPAMLEGYEAFTTR